MDEQTRRVKIRKTDIHKTKTSIKLIIYTSETW